MSLSNYLTYSPDVEQHYADEDEVIKQIGEAMANVQSTAARKNNHAFRAVHSKSHGALKGSMTVYDNLPDVFRQGIFSNQATYEVMMRFSTSPSEIFADSVGGVRGLALKVIGVKGERDSEDSADARTQDFLFTNHPTFPVKDSRAFLLQAKLLDKVVSHVPEPIQIVQDKALRAAGAVARQMGMDPAGLATGLAKANTQILGDTFWTGVPVRYGAYVAKLSVSPVSANLQNYVDIKIDESDDDALRHAVADFFEQEQAGEWEVRVQLCKNLETMPVEDPSVRWPEDESPFVPVAKIVVTKQRVFSPDRDKYSEDILSFNPWNTVAAHRPLGSIMRARKFAYDQSSKFRHNMSGCERKEPESSAEMPD